MENSRGRTIDAGSGCLDLREASGAGVPACRTAFLLARLVVCAAAVVVSGCDFAMENQPIYKPHEATSFFPDRNSARPIPEGTVPQLPLIEEAVATGIDAAGDPLTQFPMPVNRELLRRGAVVFDIYCDHCHGEDGEGDGPTVRRGFPSPPSFHDPASLTLSPGHIVEMITLGLGKMPPLGHLVSPTDRWAAAAHVIFALQQRERPLEIEADGHEHEHEH